ncbi:MAG: radical SAM protein [Phycisphaerales bacterium]|nr:radical SAM protein [Phycisphaerales bacterium]
MTLPLPSEPTVRINEVFHSIQGESTWVGEPCVFVRLTGCPLRCAYCDTAYAFREGVTRAVIEIIEQVCAFGCPLVEVTGGEPLAQRAVHGLMNGLCDRGLTVLLETSGSLDISACDPRVIRIMDLKCPSSGETEKNLWSNIPQLNSLDEVKFVIGDRADYDWAKSMIEQHSLISRCKAVLMGPVFRQAAGLDIAGHEGLNPRVLAEWVLADRLAVRMQVQMHKVIWDPQTRGV